MGPCSVHVGRSTPSAPLVGRLGRGGPSCSWAWAAAAPPAPRIRSESSPRLTLLPAQWLSRWSDSRSLPRAPGGRHPSSGCPCCPCPSTASRVGEGRAGSWGTTQCLEPPLPSHHRNPVSPRRSGTMPRPRWWPLFLPAGPGHEKPKCLSGTHSQRAKGTLWWECPVFEDQNLQTQRAARQEVNVPWGR